MTADNSGRRGLPPFVEGPLSLDTWNAERKGAILDLFRREVYGAVPDEASLSLSFRTADLQEPRRVMGGRALRKIVEVSVKRKGMEFTFPLLLFIPVPAEKKPVPAIITLCIGELSDADPGRGTISGYWPAELIVSRGYAAAAVLTHDIAPDYDENFTLKFHRLFPEYVENRPADMMGAISAWAWGLSRVVDYLQSDPLILPGEIALAGHSRGGKTALWCAAQDPRIALALISCSGCSGAALTRGKAGEHIRDITGTFPYWFCKNYQKYGADEDALPVDQHMLLGLVAPRPLYLSERSFDTWCDPKSEFKSLKEAAALYRLYGKLGEDLTEMPGPEQPVISGNIGFHVKTGEHALEEYDWERYLDFCGRYFHPVPPV